MAGVKAAQYHVKIIRRKIEEPAVKLKAQTNYSKIKEKSRTWRSNRSYENHYNAFFRTGLKKDIVDTLIGIPRKNNRPLVIIEDGAGKGVFLAELKKKLKKKNVDSKTIALTLGNNASLKERRQKNEINEIVAGPAEYYAPKEPADAIISLYGSVQYSIDALRKQHLLKFAHSLRKGGIMMVGFEHAMQTFPYLTWSGWREPKTLMNKMRSIEKALGAQGFDAKFYRHPEGKVKLPPFILIVKRR